MLMSFFVTCVFLSASISRRWSPISLTAAQTSWFSGHTRSNTTPRGWRSKRTHYSAETGFCRPEHFVSVLLMLRLLHWNTFTSGVFYNKWRIKLEKTVSCLIPQRFLLLLFLIILSLDQFWCPKTNHWNVTLHNGHFSDLRKNTPQSRTKKWRNKLRLRCVFYVSVSICQYCNKLRCRYNRCNNRCNIKHLSSFSVFRGYAQKTGCWSRGLRHLRR